MKPGIIAAVLLLVAGATAQADPNPKPSENWKTDFSKYSVDLSEIRSGGPPKDGIPPIDEPKFVSLAEATQIGDKEPVIALSVDDDARAYPLSILTWHEIVNDEVGGKPLSVTYCPLCNASIVFDRELDGQTLDFGTTGRLRNSDLVMYDRQTESWWQQFTGEAIIGELLGKKLTMVPSTTLSFDAFKERYPQGKVLVPNNPSMRRYGQNPYAYYDTADRPFLYTGAMPDGIEPMARVIIVESGDKPFVITMDAVREAGKIERDGVILEWRDGMASALDAREISKGRNIGQVLVTNEAGEELVHHVTFAFVAHAFHEDVPIEGKPG